jgi:histidinol-phosphate/aromatic aminotransferase/cobyric acid decarboxylase-like protein
LSSPSEYFLELLLKFRPQLVMSIERTIADRARLEQAFDAMDAVAEVYPSGANFLLIRLVGERELADSVRQALLVDFAIEVKDVTDRFSDRLPRLRVAVRSQTENEHLVEMLGRVYRAVERVSPPAGWRKAAAGILGRTTS